MATQQKSILVAPAYRLTRFAKSFKVLKRKRISIKALPLLLLHKDCLENVSSNLCKTIFLAFVFIQVKPLLDQLGVRGVSLLVDATLSILDPSSSFFFWVLGDS
jgi:hypothetical protein